MGIFKAEWRAAHLLHWDRIFLEAFYRSNVIKILKFPLILFLVGFSQKAEAYVVTSSVPPNNWFRGE